MRRQTHCERKNADSRLQAWANSDRLGFEMAQVKRVIIDADPGIDDTAAILMALASDKLQVEAFTTVHGNASVEQCTVNYAADSGGGWARGYSGVSGCGQDADLSHEPTYAAHVHGE